MRPVILSQTDPPGLVVPLLSRGKPIGAIEVAGKGRSNANGLNSFTPADQALLQALACHRAFLRIKPPILRVFYIGTNNAWGSHTGTYKCVDRKLFCPGILSNGHVTTRCTTREYFSAAP